MGRGEDRLYEYRVLDADGLHRTGELPAVSPQAARRHLKEAGFATVLYVKETGRTQPAPMVTNLAASRRVGGLKPQDLQLLTLHLATMLGCGVSLSQALAVLGNSEHDAVAICARRLLKHLEGGHPLSQAMSAQPETFSGSYVGVIETGEVTGGLHLSLARLAQTLERQNEVLRRLKGALVYPAFLLLSCGALMMVMLYLIFPMVISVTAAAGVEPPLLTQVLIVLTRPRTLVSLLVAIGLPIFLLVRLWLHPQRGLRMRRAFERRSPVGRFYAHVQVLSSMRHLALMVGSGVDLLKALIHSGRIGESSVLVREAFTEVIKKVKLGFELSASLEQHAVFPPALSGMVAVSEATGRLDHMLNKFCDLFEEGLNSKISVVSAALEPIILMVMGVVIGTILIAAFLPIYKLVSL